MTMLAILDAGTIVSLQGIGSEGGGQIESGREKREAAVGGKARKCKGVQECRGHGLAHKQARHYTH